MRRVGLPRPGVTPPAADESNSVGSVVPPSDKQAAAPAAAVGSIVPPSEKKAAAPAVAAAVGSVVPPSTQKPAPEPQSKQQQTPSPPSKQQPPPEPPSKKQQPPSSQSKQQQTPSSPSKQQPAPEPQSKKKQPVPASASDGPTTVGRVPEVPQPPKLTAEQLDKVLADIHVQAVASDDDGESRLLVESPLPQRYGFGLLPPHPDDPGVAAPPAEEEPVNMTQPPQAAASDSDDTGGDDSPTLGRLTRKKRIAIRDLLKASPEMTMAHKQLLAEAMGQPSWRVLERKLNKHADEQPKPHQGPAEHSHTKTQQLYERLLKAEVCDHQQTPLPVTTLAQLLAPKLAIELPKIGRKVPAKLESISRQLKRMIAIRELGLTCVTSSEKSPLSKDALKLVIAFIKGVKARIADPDVGAIVNFDEVPLFTQAVQKVKCVTETSPAGKYRKRTLYPETKTRVTVVLGSVLLLAAPITGERIEKVKQLQPFVIFRGAYETDRETTLTKFRNDPATAVQPQGWVDHRLMEKIRRHFSSQFECAGAVYYMYDNFQPHEKLEETGCFVIPGPPGCTQLWQPVDMGMGRALQTKYRAALALSAAKGDAEYTNEAALDRIKEAHASLDPSGRQYWEKAGLLKPRVGRTPARDKTGKRQWSCWEYTNDFGEEVLDLNPDNFEPEITVAEFTAWRAGKGARLARLLGHIEDAPDEYKVDATIVEEEEPSEQPARPQPAAEEHPPAAAQPAAAGARVTVSVSLSPPEPPRRAASPASSTTSTQGTSSESSSHGESSREFDPGFVKALRGRANPRAEAFLKQNDILNKAQFMASFTVKMSEPNKGTLMFNGAPMNPGTTNGYSALLAVHNYLRDKLAAKAQRKRDQLRKARRSKHHKK